MFLREHRLAAHGRAGNANALGHDMAVRKVGIGKDHEVLLLFDRNHVAALQQVELEYYKGLEIEGITEIYRLSFLKNIL